MTFQGSKKFNDLARNGYLKISNHGMIVNNRTAALVGLNGTIDWACLPNFNSPPIHSGSPAVGAATINPVGSKKRPLRARAERITSLLYMPL